MRLNLSFFRFVKHMMRDSLKMSYTEHFLSSSRSFKKMRYSLLMAGEKLMEVGQVFGKHYDSCFIVTLEHGICLHLVLQLGKLLVSESYQFSVSLYFFVHVDECYDYLQIMFLVLIASTLPILCVVILFHSCQ
jgi:hypothetical protein